MVKRMAVICDGVVVNIIMYDTEVEYTPEEGCQLVDDGAGCAIGGTYSDGVFTPPAEIE